jgi:hypothetical protein
MQLWFFVSQVADLCTRRNPRSNTLNKRGALLTTALVHLGCGHMK